MTEIQVNSQDLPTSFEFGVKYTNERGAYAILRAASHTSSFYDVYYFANWSPVFDETLGQVNSVSNRHINKVLRQMKDFLKTR